MKKTFQIISLVLVCVLLCSVAAIATGGSYTKELIAKYVGVQLVVNGTTITPKDANGKVVEPFIVDGTTYLPVRAVAEALGQEVGWDGDTKTVYIGTQPTIKPTPTPAADNGIPATSLLMSESVINTKPGETMEVRVTCLPSSAAPALTWVSSNPAVATVTFRYQEQSTTSDFTIYHADITTIADGEATITVSAPNGVSASCKVSVFSDYTGIAQLAVDSLRSSLKNPASLLLNSVRVYKGGENNDVVEIDYSAMNGFGGYNRGWYYYLGWTGSSEDFSIIDRYGYPYVSVDISKLK